VCNEGRVSDEPVGEIYGSTSIEASIRMALADGDRVVMKMDLRDACEGM